jgi:choline dehydrogenase-like flavoprotein
MTAPSQVLIVGSGPAGVSAAWPLLEAGIPVLMIDASTSSSLSVPTPPLGDIDGLRADSARWKTQFGYDLRGLAPVADQSPKLTTPVARAALAGFVEANGLTAQNFLALGSLSQGGLSTIWGAVAALYDAEDLAGFPFGPSALWESYDRVMRRIGVNGPAADHLSGARISPQVAAPIQIILDAAGTRKLPPDFTLTFASNAVLMEARAGREGCTSCGLCLWGCARGSIYASSQELPALQRFPHFEYRSGVCALRLMTLDGLPAIEVASAKGAASNKAVIAAPRILLAAGALATTTLVLRRLGGALNSVRLLTNPVAAMAFLVPSLIAKPLPKRSFSLAQLAYRLQLSSGDHAAGMFYAADALPMASIAARIPVSRPVALRLSRALAPALVLATCYLPGRYSANTMSLAGDDDSHQVTIEGQHTAEATAVLREAGRRLGHVMRRLGAWAVPGSLSPALPGADAHYAGTLPMGKKGITGSSINGELNALPGFHVIDGAALSDLPARHCTLTIMANADRIARTLIG